MKPHEFIGEKAVYDEYAQYIWRVNEEGDKHILLQVRGWGGIEKMLPNGNEASEFQDNLGEWIAEAINEKLASEKEEVNLINFSDVDERNKISNSKEEIIYSDGSSKEFDVVLIDTREDAISKVLAAMSEALKRKNALSKIKRFRNDFSRHRNYEIEYELDEFLSERTGVIYKIKEICPFNGFSWYSEEENVV